MRGGTEERGREAAAAAMDFHALSRRELQALCKRNAVRANMSNAAMADALRSLPSVDGLDEIGRAGAPPMSVVKSMEEVIVDEETTDRSLLPRAGRARSKARTKATDKVEQDVGDQATLQGIQGTEAREAVAPVKVAEVTRVEQGHGCPLPRGRRVGAMARKAAAHKTEEAVLAPDAFQGSQRTEVEEGMAPVEAKEVEVATGKRRTTRCTRSKVKMALDQKEATEWKEQKADSSDVVIGSVVVSDKSSDGPKTHEVVEEEVMNGSYVTRKPAVHEMEEVPATAILRRSQRTTAPLEAEEVTMAMKKTRRSTRSKVAAAEQKGQKGENKFSLPLVNFDCLNANFADSSIVTNGSADKSSDCPKKDEVVSVVEEGTTKPHDGGSVTRWTMAHKMEEVPVPATSQQSQRMAASEAAVPVEAEKGATTKRRRRRRRSKAAAAAWNGQNADSSDVAIESPVLVPDQSCDDLREDQLIAVVKEHVTKPQEEEQDQSSSIHKSASLVEMEDLPTANIMSCVNYIAAAADDETVKEDFFTLNSEVDQSDLLVNTLDRFSKPMHEFTIKGEKKEGECWWMLM